MDIKPKRKKSSWILALEEWNRTHNSGCFLMPKKNTQNYIEVKEIQERLDSKTPAPAPAPKRNIKFIKKAPAPAPAPAEKIIGVLPFDNQVYNMAKKMVNDSIKKNNVKFNKKQKDELYLDAYNLIVKEKAKQATARKAPKKRNIKMDLSPAPAPAPKKKRGRPKKQSGRGNDDDDWEDYNINIINEAENANIPIPAELSVVNTLYDTFGPKLPQVNTKTRKIRPAPSLFDFLNFEL